MHVLVDGLEHALDILHALSIQAALGMDRVADDLADLLRVLLRDAFLERGDDAELLAAGLWLAAVEALQGDAALDEFGLLSHQRAAAATRSGYFEQEIVPLNIELEDGSKDVHTVDEGIRFEANLEGMQSLNALREGGVITAGTASQISDGAAAIMVANEEAVRKFDLPVRAKIHSLAVVGSDPVIMLEGPIPATEKVLEKAGLSIDEIDLYEVNEAFGSVPLAWAKALNADPDKLNVNGGAQSLGHPLGGTGAKLMTTLVHELERRQARYGLVAICEGGGTANAMIIERMNQLDS